MPSEEERWEDRPLFPVVPPVDHEVMERLFQELLEKLEPMESAPLLWEGDQA